MFFVPECQDQMTDAGGISLWNKKRPERIERRAEDGCPGSMCRYDGTEKNF